MTVRSFTYEVKVNLNQEVGYGASQWQAYRDWLQRVIDSGQAALAEQHGAANISSIQVQEE